MNQNFLGAVDREDVRMLQLLRQNFIPMITALDKLQADMQFAMSKGEAVDWPQVQQMTSRVTNALSSMNTLINGGYKHETELDKETRQVPKKDDAGNLVTNSDGTPIMEAKEVTVTRYRDVPYPSHADKVKALHPFPIPPFPMMQGNAAGMANTLLRKRLEPAEEAWVEARLRKAAEFVELPAEWEIEPKKPPKDGETTDPDSDEDNEDDEDAAERMPTKRVPSKLSEDDILTLWKYAHQEVFDQTYLKEKYPEDYAGGQNGGDEGVEDEDDEDEDEDEDDDFEDVMDTSDAPGAAAAPIKSEAAASAPAAVTRAAVPKRHVHQAVPGLPVLSLGFVHKFMATGEATGQ